MAGLWHGSVMTRMPRHLTQCARSDEVRCGAPRGHSHDNAGRHRDPGHSAQRPAHRTGVPAGGGISPRLKINGLLRESTAAATVPWGIEMEHFEMKDVELPEAMQQVMAMQAEAIREKRARIIKAEEELEASRKLGDAAEQMANNPVAVELRRMQMVTEVGAENNSTTVLMIPSDFVTLAKSFTRYLDERASRKSKPSNSTD